MPSSPPGLIIQRAGKRTERARLKASSRPIRAAGSRHARSLLASHARQGHVATSKGTSWARARRATRDFLARPAGGPHDLSANGAPRSGTKSGARSAAAAQVLGMGPRCAGHIHLKRPPAAPLAAHMRPTNVGFNLGSTAPFPIGASGWHSHTRAGSAVRTHPVARRATVSTVSTVRQYRQFVDSTWTAVLPM